MLLKEFPDLQWLKQQTQTGFSNQEGWQGRRLVAPRWPSVVLNTHSSQAYRDNITGPLSFFSTRSGSAHVTVDGNRRLINAQWYFLSNPGQDYTLEIDANVPIETFNVHFGEDFYERALPSLMKSVDALLDEDSFSTQYVFFNKLQRIDAVTQRLVNRIKSSSSELQEESLLYELLAQLLHHDQSLSKSVKDIQAARKSTRDEIMKRLLKSRDYILSCYASPISLEDMAAAGCLSKFHFLRLFKSIFGKTPHQFLCEVRIERAIELLSSTQWDIKTIADQVGIENSSSFSRLFFQRKGIYPSQFRQGTLSF